MSIIQNLSYSLNDTLPSLGACLACVAAAHVQRVAAGVAGWQLAWRAVDVILG